MAPTVKRIGVLTAGGDCPGLNAVIRAVVKDACFNGLEVLGIEDGFLGLIEDRLRPLRMDDVSNILTQGGTILGSSNKANPLRFATGTNADGTPRIEDVSGKAIATIRKHGLDCIVVIGGDGSMSIAHELTLKARSTGVELRFVGVPKTIDNDLMGTEITFGHATAVATATDALDKLHSTAASHHRVMVVEVMGRNAGWIALGAGLASGSDAILIPEIPFHLETVCDMAVSRGRRGKRFSIICVAEGAAPIGEKQKIAKIDPTSPDPVRLGGIAEWLASAIEQETKIESRYVVLGHVQRGGTPVAQDRVLATMLGHRAMELVRVSRFGRMVAVQGGTLTDVAIEEVSGKQRKVRPDDPMVAAARAVYTTFGD
ncbi:MAG: ATP-dependent 6-phosphofructokinase [Phycisphaerales bacterium]|nr:ATP-dependent 6-phosphofructokinase [Phycisphaerales bacterium]